MLVVYEGRFTADPELTQTNTGAMNVRFTLAQNYKRKGEDKARFLRCEAWDKQAEAISKYFKKGSTIQVVGRLEQNTWKNDEGKTQERVFIVVNEFYFADNKKSNSGPDGDVRQPSPGEDIGDIPF